jgi:dnd system-associated protein 4
MAEHRIRIPKEHQEFIQSLLDTKETTGPFKTQADVLAFAAAVGAKQAIHLDFAESAEPIRQEIFIRQGYDTLVNLLAVFREGNPDVLASSEEMEDRRIVAFEEYANGGLGFLRNELRGELDLTDAILLLLRKERETQISEEDIDLRDLVKD